MVDLRGAVAERLAALVRRDPDAAATAVEGGAEPVEVHRVVVDG